MKDSLSLDNNEDWPFFCYLKFEGFDGLCLSDPNDDLTFSLISREKREEIVNSILIQTEKILKIYEEYL